MSAYPEKTLNEVNNLLDIRQLLELIGYRTDKLQESGETVRGFCPIHRETVFRTLIIDKGKRTFRCMYGLCDGTAGGNLVQLYALSQHLPVDEALKALIRDMNLTVALPVDPEMLEKQAEVGENYLELSYFDDAEKTFQGILAAQPDYDRALFGLLRVFEHKNDAQGQAAQHEALSRILAQRGEHGAALEHVRLWSSLAPDDPRAHRKFADCLIMDGDPNAALDELMAAADLFEAAGDFAAAVEAYKIVDGLELDLIDVNPHIIQACQQMGKPEEAVAYMVERAEAAAQRADFRKAAESFQAILDLDGGRSDLRLRYAETAALADSGGDWAPAVFETADYFLALGDSSNAIHVLAKLLDCNPGNEEAISRLATLYRQEGMVAEAQNLQVRSARLLLDSRKPDAASREIEGVLAADPEHAGALEIAAEVRAALGQSDAALDAWRQLGSVLSRQGNHARAIGVYDQMLQREPSLAEIREARADALEAWSRAGNVRARQEAAAEFEALGDDVVESDPARACSFFIRAEQTGGATPGLLLKLAHSLVFAGDPVRARDAAFRACDGLAEAGNADAALSGADGFADLLPGDEEAAAFAAGIHLRLGRTEDAVQRFLALAGKAEAAGNAPQALGFLNRVLGVDPLNVEAIESLGRIHLAGGDEAGYTDSLLRLANAHEQRGSADKAIATLETLVQRRDGDVLAVTRLANLNEQRGDSQGARKWRLHLARLHHGRGAFDAEAEILQEVLAAGADEEVLSLLVACEFARGNSAAACGYARRLAAVQMKAGFAANARATLAGALAKAPDDELTNRGLFDALRSAGLGREAAARGLRLVEVFQTHERIEDAAAMYEELVACDPDDLALSSGQIDFLRGAGKTAEAAAKQFNLAKHFRARGDIDSAEGALREILVDAPDDIRALEEMLSLHEEAGDAVKVEEFAKQLGEVHCARGNAKKAISMLKRALKALPESIVLRQQLADLYREQNRTADAVRELLALAELLTKLGSATEALEAQRNAAGLSPADTQVRRRYVDSLVDSGQLEDAAAQLEELATLQADNRKFPRALETLNELLNLMPERLGARRLRAEVYSRMGDEQSAQEELRVFYLKSLLKQAGVYRDAGDFQRESATLREALNHAPDDEEILRLLVESDFALGDGEAACAATRLLARTLSASGRDDEARAALARTLEKVPDNIDATRDLFDALLKAEEPGEAVVRGCRLAELLYEADRKDEAAGVFDEVIRCDPDNADLRDRHVEFLRKLGRNDDALAKLLDLAAAATACGDTARAEQKLLDALNIDGSCIAALESLVEVFEDTGNTDGFVERLRTLADIHAAAGDHAKAEAALRRAITKADDTIPPRRQLVALLKDSGSVEGAVAELRKLADELSRSGLQLESLAAEQEAVSLAPLNPVSRRRFAEALISCDETARGIAELEALAGIHAEEEEFAKALEVLSEAESIDPGRLELRKLRADVFERMGDAVRANEEKREYEGLSALARATAARAGEDRDAEAEALREALLHIPDSEDVLSRMVECEAARGRETDAQEASRLLAVVQRTAGRDADAAGTLAAALERAPRDIETLRDYCDVLREAGKPEEALARGLTLVDLLADESRFDEAAATFDSLVRLDDANLDLREKEIDFLLKLGRLSASHEKLFELASRYSDAGDADAGELTLLRVLDADAGNIRALSALVSLHEAGGRREQLENRLQELAEAQFAAGLFEDAVSTSRRLLATNPENVDARRQLVRFHAERGLVEEAIDELFGLADQLRANEAGADAVDAEREAVLLAPAHQGARRRLAESLLREGDEAGGIAELEELARVQSDGGEFELALETLASVLERSPDRTAARVQRAEVYAKKGDQEKALEEYRAVSTSLSQGAAAKADAPSAPPVQPTLQLVREYDFDRFVIGGNNNFAYATALAVARAPAQAYNPLFIYSDVGLGKTHLVNAIANHMLKQNPGARIIYTNSEDFTAEVVEAIQTNTIIQFRTKYKTVDLLIVDDVQFLAGKERAQEEFFHIFNALFQAKRQIVITSDRPPKDIARLENRLLSRFGAGVIVDIAAPDVETRTAILHREIANSQLEIEPGIAVLIAERVCSNVRELKGALNQIVAMRTLRGMEPNEENVRQVLDSLYVRA